MIVKEVAINHAKSLFNNIGDIMHSAYFLNGFFTLSISFLFIFLAPWLSNNVFYEPRLTYPLIISLLVLTPQVISRVLSSGLVGVRQIWQSNLVEQTLSISITGLLLLVLYTLKFDININVVAILYGIGRISVTISIGIYWRKLFKYKAKWNPRPMKLLLSSFPFFLSTISAIIISNADTIFLGIFRDAREIGLYAVAIKIAFLTSFFLQITNSSVGPKIAALYEKGLILETQMMVKKVTRGLFFLGLIPLIIFIIFGKYILSMWGPEFTSAYYILIVLSVGQLINIGTGAVGQLLTMTGNEKSNKNIMLVFVFINLLLNLVLINFYGLLGAAFANMVTVVGMNLVKVKIAKQKTGISTI